MRMQALFLDMGAQVLERPFSGFPARERAPERVAAAVGFVETKSGLVEDGTMRQVGFAFHDDGGATVRLDRDAHRPDVPFDPEECSYNHLMREPIWRAGGTMLALLSHALGSALFRATRMPPVTEGNEVLSFVAPLKLPGRMPVFNKLYAFEDDGRECRCVAPVAVPELALTRGVYAEHYLTQPGWNFAGRKLALRSTLPLAVLDDLDEIERLEASGDEQDRLAALLSRRRGILFGRGRDDDYAAFRAAMTEIRRERGLDHSWSAPVDADGIAADGAVADEAIRRAMSERQAAGPRL